MASDQVPASTTSDRGMPGNFDDLGVVAGWAARVSRRVSSSIGRSAWARSSALLIPLFACAPVALLMILAGVHPLARVDARIVEDAGGGLVAVVSAGGQLDGLRTGDNVWIEWSDGSRLAGVATARDRIGLSAAPGSVAVAVMPRDTAKSGGVTDDLARLAFRDTSMDWWDYYRDTNLDRRQDR